MANQPQDPKDVAGRDPASTPREPTSEGARPIQTPDSTQEMSPREAGEKKEDESLHGHSEGAASRQGKEGARIVAPTDPDVIRGASPEEETDANNQKRSSPGANEKE